MKNGKWMIAVAMLTLLTGCSSVDSQATSTVAQSFSVTEIESNNFIETPTQFILTNSSPCVLIDGVAYLYEDGIWNEIHSDEKLSEIYPGDIFCALTEDGGIIVGSEDWKDYENELP